MTPRHKDVFRTDLAIRNVSYHSGYVNVVFLTAVTFSPLCYTALIKHLVVMWESIIAKNLYKESFMPE